jgi:serine/threonine protein phosphatase PrpC
VPTLALEAAVRSDAGRRPGNEDAVYASPRLAAVADGVGGHAAGEVASAWAIQAIIALDKSRLSLPLDAAVRAALAWGNDTIGFVAECRPETAGMGTTLTAVALDANAYVVANIGDSRTYLLRDGELMRLSRDDSLVEDLVERGHITPAQARRHPARSFVLQALDGAPGRTPAVKSVPALAGDRLLLCSDGLSDVVGDEEIAAQLARHASRSACADRLVQLALDAGARDNVSVIVADVVIGDAALGWQPALTL